MRSPKRWRGVLVMALLLGFGSSLAQAAPVLYPPCGPYQYPTEEAFCRPAFMHGMGLAIVADVPFAWLREAPASDAGVLAVIAPGGSLRVEAAGEEASVWDGTQWWWRVVGPDGSAGPSWVEQASLTYAGGAELGAEAILLADWASGDRLMLRPGIPFLWLRETPDSHAAVVGTLHPGDMLRVLGDPTFDGAQYWWAVDGLTTRGWQRGYVEQARIIPAW